MRQSSDADLAKKVKGVARRVKGRGRMAEFGDVEDTLLGCLGYQMTCQLWHSSKPTLEGVIRKRDPCMSKMKSGWHRRYFILHGSVLYYYRSEESPEMSSERLVPAGFIPLAGIDIVGGEGSEKAVRSKKEGAFEIRVTSGADRNLVFKPAANYLQRGRVTWQKQEAMLLCVEPNTNAERDRWIGALRAACVTTPTPCAPGCISRFVTLGHDAEQAADVMNRLEPLLERLQ